MSEFTARVRANGQVTVPQEVCVTERIKTGNFVRFQIIAVVSEQK
jgi:bifunctional DNA-binding transcriptional regulator/antitoxin component of YhaV-PrlF toxin-antitoxin module